MLSFTLLCALAWKNRALPILNSGVSIVSLEDLYNALLEADMAWNRELRRMWGRDADKARSDVRGVLTPRLRALHDECSSRNQIYMEALAASSEALRSAA
jgi:hypothetical protein